MGMMIFGDWGTSRLRLFLHDGRAVVDRTDAPGIGMLQVPPLEALLSAIGPWVDRHGAMNVTLCGMVGSRNGLVEVPYVPCPVDIGAWAARKFELSAEGLVIQIASGLSCTSPVGTPDVMRGEETQIFGALCLDAGRMQGRHLFVLPGTHSKWAAVEGGQVTAFHTFPTGEMFTLLRDHSTLTRAGDNDEDGDAGFSAGLERAWGGPGLLSLLFEARSAQLLEGRSRGWALGLLSGLLIGREITDALEIFGSVGDVAIIGDPTLTRLYRQAFSACGMTATDLDGNTCALTGLKALGKGGC